MDERAKTLDDPRGIALGMALAKCGENPLRDHVPAGEPSDKKSP